MNPPLEASMAGLVRRVFVGQVVPWGPRTQHPQDPIEHLSRRLPGPTLKSRRLCLLPGEEGFEEGPLNIRQVHASMPCTEAALTPERRSGAHVPCQPRLC